MFSHKGKTRTPKHNLQIASLLSFVAGLVNVVGFFSVQKLTTNVTGHFAFLIDEVFKLHFVNAFHIAFFLIAFLLGSFVANFTVEYSSRNHENQTFLLPVIFEAAILLVIALTGNYLIQKSPDIIVCCLLFAMGMQNSLVTSISKSVVRTTHLTGLFTDLGIELSQLFFYKNRVQKNKLHKSINLRLTIITMFFSGGLMGGILFDYFGIRSLLLGTLILISGLVYDFTKIKILLLKRKV
ncbi:YoaK family protein [Halpernia sp. GG3]